ncbi:hypothetical protein BDF20DRAFT_913870 [Mycotypha africana]|uniref:uncharacterized protein n=1 Tax=Mycotypha africana TaxID=64632 RepID=UPI0023014115|nr:uncharacterized protein BDF20DRAFT_913870 [Mycotypha africana]KAI8977561.1 hypothetical protein BDF20DRAFT_913870 [Mycotypha africana]
MEQLLNLRMAPRESIDAITDRFERLRRAAKRENDVKTATLLRLSLLPKLRPEVARLLLNVPLSITTIKDDDTSNARTNNTVTISAQFHLHDPSPILTAIVTPNLLWESIKILLVTQKTDMNAPYTAGEINQLNSVKYKEMMAQQCQKQPNFTIISTAAPEVSNPSRTFRSKNICFNCSANVPWSPEHASVCTRDKQ